MRVFTYLLPRPLFARMVSGFINSVKEGYLMKCPRCSGVMAYEKFYGPHEQFFGWRCIYCGEIVDQVILENRFERTH